MLKSSQPGQSNLSLTQVSPTIRQWKVFIVAIRLCLGLSKDKLFGRDSAKNRRKRAHWLVKNLLSLGPTFIKIGQALSTRADLIPLEYVQALSELQDKVPPFDSELAIAEIEKELGKPLYTCFRDFDPTPIASASLGQVHKARLHTGEDVVVKVQRPGLERLFNLDLEISHRLVRLANFFWPGIRKYRLEAIYSEFFELLYQEIDYIQEGKNAERFRQNFHNYSRVLIPRVYWQYSTKKILTLEYLPGIKIDDRNNLEANKINTKEVIQLGITCYLKQLLQDGFFQSDPHPGNMAVSRRGEIIFYDFGTMAEVKSMAQEQMINTFFAVLRKDADGVIESLIYMGLIEPMPDMTPIKRLVNFILEKFRDKPIDIREFEQISQEIYLMFEQQPFRLPPQMTFIIKSLTTLDGIARALDPQYNLLAASAPFVKSMALQGNKGSLWQGIARQTSQLIRQRLNKPRATEIILRRLESKLELGELQVKVRSENSERTLQKINLGIKSLIYACISGFALLSGTLLLVNSPTYQGIAIALFSFAVFWFLLLLRSLINLAIKEKLDKLR